MKKIIVSLTIVIALMLSACSNNSIPPINITIPEDTINEMANKLSKEMEDYYVTLKDDGDTKAKDILIEHNLYLIVLPI